MLRSAIPRFSAAGSRAMSSSGTPSVPPPSGAPKPTSAPSPPMQASAPPSPPRGFVKRATPVLLTAGTGFLVYRVYTDEDFRDRVQKVFPSVSSLLAQIPKTDPRPLTRSASARVHGVSDDDGTTTLPPGYDNVPSLLRKIEESQTSQPATDEQIANRQTTISSRSEIPQPEKTPRADIMHASPTRRAFARDSENSSDDLARIGDGPIHTRNRPTASLARKNSSTPDCSVTSASADANRSSERDKSFFSEVMTAVDNDSYDANNARDAKASGTTTTGKGKLERILGKGDFHPERMKGVDIIDDSAYEEPKALSFGSSSSKESGVFNSSGGLKPQSPDADKNTTSSSAHADENESWTSTLPGKVNPWKAKTQDEKLSERFDVSNIPSRQETHSGSHQDSKPHPELSSHSTAPTSSHTSTELNSVSVSELIALRRELESQAKWEGVRLQEAVRAQIIEDKKAAAREAATLAKDHEQKLLEVKEKAVYDANRVIKEKAMEIKAKVEAERDADLKRLVKEKEEALREALQLEYTSNEQRETLNRGKALTAAKAEVEALRAQFDAIVNQNENSREAARRASSAFLLQESLVASRPIESQLSEACSKTELGELVAGSVPISVVEKGIESVEELQRNFKQACAQGLSVAMVPEGSAGTIWGQMLGAIFSRLKIPVDNRVEEGLPPPSTNEDCIRKASLLVDDGDLGGALQTLESLKGLSAEVMSDWVSGAKARLAANLAAQVLLADAIIAEVALSEHQAAESKQVIE